jgi:LPXTG-site transpeptidase (sortase) family protein
MKIKEGIVEKQNRTHNDQSRKRQPASYDRGQLRAPAARGRVAAPERAAVAVPVQQVQAAAASAAQTVQAAPTSAAPVNQFVEQATQEYDNLRQATGEAVTASTVASALGIPLEHIQVQTGRTAAVKSHAGAHAFAHTQAHHGHQTSVKKSLKPTLQKAKATARRALRLDEIGKAKVAPATTTVAPQIVVQQPIRQPASAVRQPQSPIQVQPAAATQPTQPAQISAIHKTLPQTLHPQAASPHQTQTAQPTSTTHQIKLAPAAVHRPTSAAPTHQTPTRTQPQPTATALRQAAAAETLNPKNEAIFADILERQRKKAQPLRERFKLHLKSRSLTDYIRYGAVAVVLLISGYLAYDTWMTNRQAQDAFSAPASALAVAGESTAPEDLDETSVSNEEKDSYRVPFDMPRYLSIPKLGLKNARVLSVGLTRGGKIDAPKSIHDVGWYDGSAKPNTEGAAFIDGHTAGANIGGVFDNLPGLKNGDVVNLELGDGTMINYKVVHVETVAASRVDMLKALSVYNNLEQGLNLMTCSGNYDFRTQSYDKRTIIYTLRI